MDKPIHVFSEIGKLKTVLLKRPGQEVENLTPDIMDRLLFDDIPYFPLREGTHEDPLLQHSMQYEIHPTFYSRIVL